MSKADNVMKFTDAYWVCACVKRRKGLMTHIKGHHPSVKKCRRCGCTKEQHDKIAAEVAR